MEIELKKICTGCETLQPHSNYRLRKTGRFGLQSRCRDCQSTAEKVRRDSLPAELKSEKSRKHREKIVALNISRIDELNSDYYRSKTYFCTYCSVEKTLRDFRSDMGKPLGYSTQCRDCLNEIERDRYGSNPAVREYDAKYRKENPEIYRKASLTYFYENKESRKVIAKIWREVNRGFLNAKDRAKLDWICRATPAWASKKEIEEVYIYAQMWTILTGIQQSVDHEIPLRSSIVCGFHSRENLRIMPLISNISKSNKFDPDTFIGP